jgi:hypothetical protein
LWAKVRFFATEKLLFAVAILIESLFFSKAYFYFFTTN